MRRGRASAPNSKEHARSRRNRTSLGGTASSATIPPGKEGNVSITATNLREKLKRVSGLSQEGKQELDGALIKGDGFIVLRHGQTADAMLRNFRSVEASNFVQKLHIVVLSPEDSNIFFQGWERSLTGQLTANLGSIPYTPDHMLIVYPD